MTRISIVILCIAFVGGMLTSAWSAQCNVTATPLTFGSYDTLDPAPLDSTATLSINCKPKQPFVVEVQISAGASGSFGQRTLLGPGTLLYNLYTDASMSTLFGDGTGGSATLTRIVDRNTPWNLNFYGRIPALQLVPAGLYSDTLTATILW